MELGEERSTEQLARSVVVPLSQGAGKIECSLAIAASRRTRHCQQLVGNLRHGADYDHRFLCQPSFHDRARSFDRIGVLHEGRLVAIIPPDEADRALAAMRAHPIGSGACRIGQVTEHRPRQVVMHTVLGGQRIVDMLVGDPLPRIC